MPEMAQMVRAIVTAVALGTLPQERLDAAALSVASLADRLAGRQ